MSLEGIWNRSSRAQPARLAKVVGVCNTGWSQPGRYFIQDDFAIAGYHLNVPTKPDNPGQRRNNMRKIILCNFVILDGYYEGRIKASTPFLSTNTKITHMTIPSITTTRNGCEQPISCCWVALHSDVRSQSSWHPSRKSLFRIISPAGS